MSFLFSLRAAADFHPKYATRLTRGPQKFNDASLCRVILRLECRRRIKHRRRFCLSLEPWFEDGNQKSPGNFTKDVFSCVKLPR